jgi:hypothetical protein
MSQIYNDEARGGQAPPAVAARELAMPHADERT